MRWSEPLVRPPAPWESAPSHTGPRKCDHRDACSQSTVRVSEGYTFGVYRQTLAFFPRYFSPWEAGTGGDQGRGEGLQARPLQSEPESRAPAGLAVAGTRMRRGPGRLGGCMSQVVGGGEEGRERWCRNNKGRCFAPSLAQGVGAHRTCHRVPSLTTAFLQPPGVISTAGSPYSSREEIFHPLYGVGD